ncbi:MAG: MiaB/RimO family radical SAM methylthiotransferase [Myxococcota bacterium]
MLDRFAHVDFVYGTHHLRSVPELLVAAGRRNGGPRWARTAAPHAASTCRSTRAQPGGVRRKAFVTVMEGCDMFCSFCIVPLTRGREVSRAAADIEHEVRALVDRGIREVTLLGQTVNAYGRHAVRRGQTAATDTMPFADLLARLDAIPGIERIRYTSPHPLFFDEALVQAHGALEHLCPHVHLPLQSGSDRILDAMRRRYTRARYVELAAALHAARPGLVLTTDLIVGFPGETEHDFEATLSILDEADLVDSFSFKYSPRPGTRAAELAPTVSPEQAQERLVRLQTRQSERTLAYHRSRVGEVTRVLIDGPSRLGDGQVSGRDPHLRVVNLAAEVDPAPVSGDLVAVRITAATPHSLRAVPLGAEQDQAGPSEGAEARSGGAGGALAGMG